MINIIESLINIYKKKYYFRNINSYGKVANQPQFTLNAAAFYSKTPQQNLFKNMQTDSPTHSRNVSYLNFNGGHNSGTESFPAIYSHTRNDSKNNFPIKEERENSYIELNEQMRFIEELLRDDDQSLKTFYEKTESQIEHGGSLFYSPNHSVTNLPHFGRISGIKEGDNSSYFFKEEQMERMHSKSLSDDFNFSKRQPQGDEINKAHGRVLSTFEKKN